MIVLGKSHLGCSPILEPGLPKASTHKEMGPSCQAPELGSRKEESVYTC